MYDTIVSIPKYRLEEILSMEVGDCIEIYDDNGVLGFLERIDEWYDSNIEIEGKKYRFNYFCPNEVKVRWY